MSLFTLCYTLLASLLYVVALPLIILFSFKTKYKISIPARFFLRKNPPFVQNDIWFHVCSLGEARALKPIIDGLHEEKKVDITTITHTGFVEARKYKADVRYLPYEILLPFWVKKHKVLVVLEAEFWYLLFAVVASKGTRLVLLNARISERSLPRYMKFAWFYKRLFQYVDKIYTQSEADKNRFMALGARDIEVIGNIKLAQKIEATKHYEKPKGETIVAASTHDGEEAAILDAFIAYKTDNTKARLIVVPRHPERFESVWQMIERIAQEKGYSRSRFSESKNFVSDIVLIDAMGELNNIYNISDVAILGGAFASIGGHNPLEPAHFGCKIITGTHFFLQRELFKYVHHVQFVQEREIAEALEKAKTLPPSIVDETIELEGVLRELNNGESYGS